MDIVTVENIVNKYGEVLENAVDNHEILPYGGSELLLPFVKDRIKEALKLLALYIPPTDQNMRGNIIGGYYNLSYFINNDDATYINNKDFVEDFLLQPTDVVISNKLNFISTDRRSEQRFIEINNKILHEKDILYAEILSIFRHIDESRNYW